jgi:hypothetical protein
LALLPSLIIGSCRLESMLIEPGDYDGAAIRLKLDATDRMMSLYADDREFVRHLQESIENYRRKAADLRITIPAAPSIQSTSFYREHLQTLRFAEEVARADDLAVTMHTKRDQGNIEFHTKVVDARLAKNIAGMSVLALTASTIAFATGLGWPYDEEMAAELQQEGARLADEPS